MLINLTAPVTRMVEAAYLHVGDTVIVGDRPHLVDRITPYNDPAIPDCIGIAHADHDWTLYLWDTSYLEVVR
jgi:hypothetical protein